MYGVPYSSFLTHGSKHFLQSTFAHCIPFVEERVGRRRQVVAATSTTRFLPTIAHLPPPRQEPSTAYQRLTHRRLQKVEALKSRLRNRVIIGPGRRWECPASAPVLLTARV